MTSASKGLASSRRRPGAVADPTLLDLQVRHVFQVDETGHDEADADGEDEGPAGNLTCLAAF